MDIDTIIQLDKVQVSVHLLTSFNWSEQHPEPQKWSTWPRGEGRGDKDTAEA